MRVATSCGPVSGGGGGHIVDLSTSAEPSVVGGADSAAAVAARVGAGTQGPVLAMAPASAGTVLQRKQTAVRGTLARRQTVGRKRAAAAVGRLLYLSEELSGESHDLHLPAEEGTSTMLLIGREGGETSDFDHLISLVDVDHPGGEPVSRTHAWFRITKLEGHFEIEFKDHMDHAEAATIIQTPGGNISEVGTTWRSVYDGDIIWFVPRLHDEENDEDVEYDKFNFVLDLPLAVRPEAEVEAEVETEVEAEDGAAGSSAPVESALPTSTGAGERKFSVKVVWKDEVIPRLLGNKGVLVRDITAVRKGRSIVTVPRAAGWYPGTSSASFLGREQGLTASSPEEVVSMFQCLWEASKQADAVGIHFAIPVAHAARLAQDHQALMRRHGLKQLFVLPPCLAYERLLWCCGPQVGVRSLLRDILALLGPSPSGYSFFPEQHQVAPNVTQAVHGRVSQGRRDRCAHQLDVCSAKKEAGQMTKKTREDARHLVAGALAAAKFATKSQRRAGPGAQVRGK
jgi:hypothetical protein